MAFSDWSARLSAVGATSVELTSIGASYLQDAANVRAALDLLIATQSNAELLTMLNVWRANPGPFRNGYPGGGLLFGTGVAVLTGNPADDTSAISAGTGIKLTTAIGKDQANGVAGLDASGLLKVAELPSTVATVSSGSSAKLPKFYVAAPSGDTSGAADAAAITATVNALQLFANGNGIVQFQAGVYYDNAARDYHATTGIIWQGVGGNTPGASPGTCVNYVGAAARYLDARSSNGFQIRDMMVSATNASFTGNLIDLSHDGVTNFDANSWEIRDCYLRMTATSAGAVVYLDNAITGHICHNHIAGGAYGVQGVAVSGHYSNAIQINGQNQFGHHGTAAISGPGQGWSICGNTFELQNGNAAIEQAFGSGIGSTIAGNWFGDATGSPTIITAGDSTVITGNYIGGTATSTGVAIPAGAVGVVVKGNRFASLNVGISLAATATDCEIFPNAYNSVTTPYTAPTVTVGAAAGTGGTASIAGSDWGGKVSITCGATGTAAGVLATINLASTHKGHWAIVSPAANGALINIYPSNVTDTTIVLTCQNAPAANSTPNFYYMLIPAQ